MVPARTKAALAVAWILFWLMMVATAVQDYQRGGGHALWQPVLWETSSAITSTLLMLVQRRVTRRYDNLLATPLRWFARQALWALVYWTAFVPLAFGMRHTVYALTGQEYRHPDWPHTFLYEDVKITIFFCIFTAIMFGVLSYQAMLNEKLAAERAQASLQQAQLLRLTQQMQPHFLFNALNTISSLMHSDVARADALLIQLSDVLRATLDAGDQHQVPLEMELRLLRGYAALMSERFADRVQIEWRIDESLLACQAPVMSMQPLLENVFKHTVETRRQMTHIVISVSQERGQLVLHVSDDGGQLAPARDATASAVGNASRLRLDAAANGNDGAGGIGGGIGIRNLRRRLSALYGDAATLTLTQLSPAGVRAEIRLPCVS